MPFEQRILTGLFLCSDKPNEILQHLKPEWDTKIEATIKEKLSILSDLTSANEVFPWKDELSEGIGHEKFCESFFIQPDLFLRLRPGEENSVLSKLESAEIEYMQIDDTCISLPNASKIENIIDLNKEIVVQDYSSQHIAEFFQNLKPHTINHKLTVWDCCAASGGKSILAKDILGDIDLTVSDIRESIIANLKKRFTEAGIKDYKSFVMDISDPNLKQQASNFELIIADVPCTGSGTWSRTPEQLFYFKDKKIEEYAALQKKIVSNIISYLKPVGYLLYITCSVFKKENEEMIDFVRGKSGFEIIKMKVLEGYDRKADTMFAALLKKTL